MRAAVRVPLRKVGLGVHVIASVGWMGGVAAFTAVAFLARAGSEPAALAAAGEALAVIGWAVVVPLAAAAIVSGIAQSLATEWGLARHYWLVFKLIATGLATLMLLLHMGAVTRLATVEAGTVPVGQLLAIRAQLGFDAAGGLVVLLAIAMLSFFKPRGLTRRGWRALPPAQCGHSPRIEVRDPAARAG
jgi:hypothetical protein